jgi:hypothetical protein
VTSWTVREGERTATRKPTIPAATPNQIMTK